MLLKCYFGVTQILILFTPQLLLVYQFQQLPDVLLIKCLPTRTVFPN